MISRMVDLGCGYGGLTECIASYFQVREAYGVDMDGERLLLAGKRGIKIYALNLEHDLLPFDGGSIDLVTSFGVLEHLTYYDNLISEASRVLTRGGYFLMSMPNLASYVNRIALLFGYQPRIVELSSKGAFGVLPLYRNRGSNGHIRTATLRAMRELLHHYKLEYVRGRGFAGPAFPYLMPSSNIVDKALHRFPSLSRRFILLAARR